MTGYTATPAHGRNYMTNAEMILVCTQLDNREFAERNVGTLMEDFSMYCTVKGLSTESAAVLLDFLKQPTMGHWKLNAEGKHADEDRDECRGEKAESV